MRKNKYNIILTETTVFGLRLLLCMFFEELSHYCCIISFKDMLLSASLAVMAEAVKNPERITKYVIIRQKLSI